MIPTKKEIHIHLGASHYTLAGQIHLLAAPADYVELQEFFSKHFDTLNYTHDEMGFPETLYRCPKGFMFVRHKDGEIGSIKE